MKWKWNNVYIYIEKMNMQCGKKKVWRGKVHDIHEVCGSQTETTHTHSTEDETDEKKNANVLKYLWKFVMLFS